MLSFSESQHCFERKSQTTLSNNMAGNEVLFTPKIVWILSPSFNSLFTTAFIVCPHFLHNLLKDEWTTERIAGKTNGVSIGSFQRVPSRLIAQQHRVVTTFALAVKAHLASMVHRCCATSSPIVQAATMRMKKHVVSWKTTTDTKQTNWFAFESQKSPFPKHLFWYVFHGRYWLSFSGSLLKTANVFSTERSKGGRVFFHNLRDEVFATRKMLKRAGICVLKIKWGY